MSGRRAHQRLPAADPVEAAFRPIRADRRHGAHALAEAALRALAGILDRWSHPPGPPSRTTIRDVARVLEAAQPAMGPFVRWAAEWQRIERSSTPDAFVRTARAWLRRESARLRGEESRLARTARKRFPRAARHVVTISRSRSVLRALSALSPAQRPAEVTVLESLPGGEGRRFARDLRRAGLSARMVPDTEASGVVRSADLVLIGADAVYADGSIAHKVGTKELAEAAFRNHVPVIVVAGRSKFTERPFPRRPLPAWFDRTPSRTITEVWTDVGVRAGGRSRRHVPRPAPL